MNDIVYMIKKSLSARFFVIVALSLAMAILVGGGFHAIPASKVENGVIIPVPAANGPTLDGASVAPRTGAFDRAVRDMATQQRNAPASSPAERRLEPRQPPAAMLTRQRQPVRLCKLLIVRPIK